MLTWAEKEKSSIFYALLAVIVWGHYVLSAVILIALGIWSYFDKTAKQGILSDKTDVFTIFALSGLSMISSIVAVNFPGMGIAFGVFLALTVVGAAKGLASEKAFDVFSVLCCFFSMGAGFCAFLQKSYYTEGYRPTAGAMNANYLGAITVMTMCIAGYRLFHSPSTEKGHSWYRPTKLFYLATLGVGVITLLLSESRSSLLAFMAAAGIYLLLSGRILLLAALAVCGVGIWTVGWFYPELFSWTNSLSFIITERSEIWKDAFSSFLNPQYGTNIGKFFAWLFGRGPMTYYMVWQTEGLHEANHAHNLFFDSLLNVGVVGTILYIGFVVLVVKLIIDLKKKNKKEYLLIAMLLAAVAVQGIVDVTIMWHQSAALFAAVLGYLKYKKTSNA